jgi:hypothetical protein
MEESNVDSVEFIFVPKHEWITIEPCDLLDSITM